MHYLFLSVYIIYRYTHSHSGTFNVLPVAEQEQERLRCRDWIRFLKLLSRPFDRRSDG